MIVENQTFVTRFKKWWSFLLLEGESDRLYRQKKRSLMNERRKKEKIENELYNQRLKSLRKRSSLCVAEHGKHSFSVCENTKKFVCQRCNVYFEPSSWWGGDENDPSSPSENIVVV